MKLEITESAYIDDVTAAQATLKRMQSIGIGWSIDDFGTGYSSLSYLHRLQADPSRWIAPLSAGSAPVTTERRWFSTIVALAQNLGMDVVAEGVETAEQMSQLEALGCEARRGFYLSRPSMSLRRIA